jgi:hypothetical protein
MINAGGLTKHLVFKGKLQGEAVKIMLDYGANYSYMSLRIG